MQLKVSELERKGYKEQDKFHYQELKAFVGTYFAKSNAATIFFLIANMVFFLALAIKVALVAKGKTEGITYILYFVSGFPLLILLIPIHEAIHAVAYKLCGAGQVSFNVNIRKFVFLTVADKFVASKSEFFKVLLAPFTVITVLLAVLFFAVSPYLQCSILVALVCHTFACSGDFALLSYFLSHKDKEIVTFDDAGEQMVYFYSR